MQSYFFVRTIVIQYVPITVLYQSKVGFRYTLTMPEKLVVSFHGL